MMIKVGRIKFYSLNIIIIIIKKMIILFLIIIVSCLSVYHMFV